MDRYSLKTELRQQLKLAPQQLLSAALLQMTTLDLAGYLQQAAQENPLLEQTNPPDLSGAWEALRRQASWLDPGPASAVFAHADPGPWDQGRPDRETECLAAFLRDQLERRHLPKPLLSLCSYLTELVDEDGYLSREDLESLADLRLPAGLMDQALETLQSLEPAGVCARDLSECLTLQLNRLGNVPPAAREILSRFLPELGRKQYGLIGRELGLSLEEVRSAARIIAALDPRPGQGFQPEEPPVYVRPDLFIVDDGGTLRAVLNEYGLPQVRVSSYYVRLLRESPDPETREYLREKLRQAKWLLDGLERRGGTLQRCADAILEAQYPFFTGETRELSPMKLSTLAESLELHPSTVSRATHGKYLQCRQGLFPLRYFFSREVGGSSRQAVQQRLLALVRGENPQRPFSDRQLSQLLSGDGAAVSRRTVAKYRLELGIGSSSARRRRG